MPISYKDNQHRLSEEIRSGKLTGYKKSAVMLPLVFDDGEWKLLMTQRTSTIPYGGQITFPGGQIDGDESPPQAALREGKEEINLDPKKVAIIDAMSASVTQVKHKEVLRTYTMNPLVAVIHDHSALDELKPSPGEVERIIKIPVKSLLSAVAAFQTGSRNGLEPVEVDGVSQYQFVLPDPDQADKTITIRNVTAGILFDFVSQFRDEQALKEYVNNKGEKTLNADLRGKKILVLGGSPREIIDGVRHYTNLGRSEAHGAQAAQALAQAGAEVTLVTAKTHAPKPSGVTIIDTVDGRKIGSTSDLLAGCEQHCAGQKYDAVVQLANIPAIKPVQQSKHKLKVKKEAGALVPMEVVGNTDIAARLRGVFTESTIVGYDNQQQWFGQGDAQLAQPIQSIAEQHRDAQVIPPAQQAVSMLPSAGKLTGRKIIITSGPTAEPISATGDVITNFSSGKQGHAVAEALAKMGAQVVLVSGPTYLPDPAHPNIRTVHVDSAKAMRDASVTALPADAFVGVAAIADFGMHQLSPLNLKEGEPHTLQLSQNPDILQTMGTHSSQRPAVVVGFAAETHDLLTYARGKLEKKGADFICANQVGETMVERGSDVNTITFVTPEGNEELPEMTKDQVGEAIGDKIARLLLKAKQEAS